MQLRGTHLADTGPGKTPRSRGAPAASLTLFCLTPSCPQSGRRYDMRLDERKERVCSGGGGHRHNGMQMDGLLSAGQS